MRCFCKPDDGTGRIGGYECRASNENKQKKAHKRQWMYSSEQQKCPQCIGPQRQLDLLMKWQSLWRRVCWVAWAVFHALKCLEGRIDCREDKDGNTLRKKVLWEQSHCKGRLVTIPVQYVGKRGASRNCAAKDANDMARNNNRGHRVV